MNRYKLREIEEDDLPDLAALISQVAVEPMSLSQLQGWHIRQPEGQISRCRVASIRFFSLADVGGTEEGTQ